MREDKPMRHNVMSAGEEETFHSVCLESGGAFCVGSSSPPHRIIKSLKRMALRHHKLFKSFC